MSNKNVKSGKIIKLRQENMFCKLSEKSVMKPFLNYYKYKVL